MNAAIIACYRSSPILANRGVLALPEIGFASAEPMPDTENGRYALSPAGGWRDSAGYTDGHRLQLQQLARRLGLLRGARRTGGDGYRNWPAAGGERKAEGAARLP